MSFLIFIAVLSILIVVHEYGHFAMAKRLGVRVERFSIGFGPRLFSRMHQGTEFTVSLIPLGGYVKMAGDERNLCHGKKDEFYAHTPGHRFLIVLMGPVVNYLLAFVCFWIVFVIGYPTVAAKVGDLVQDYPAVKAGLMVGDQVLKVDQKSIEGWEDMQEAIASSKGQTIEFVVLQAGKEKILTIVPTIEELENIFGQKEKVRLVGIRPAEEVLFLKYNPLVSLSKAWERLWEITTMTYKALYRMATGAMSPKDSMTGPIGIFYIIQKAAEMGFSYLLYIMGIISASLAIFNLLPLPVLDGGHLVLSAVEKCRGRPIPQKVDEIISRIGVSFIICLALFVFYSDFVRFGLIDKMVDIWNKWRL